jgi:hypothetical protein
MILRDVLPLKAPKVFRAPDADVSKTACWEDRIMKTPEIKFLTALAKRVKDPELVAALVVILGGFWITVTTITTANEHLGFWVTAVVVVFGGIGLAIMSLYYRQQNQRDAGHLREQIKELENQSTESIAQLEQTLRNRPVVATPRDYFDTLKEWNESGPGCVLLYNIELQSFRDRELLKRTWGRIAKLENIRKVVLLLPETKTRRWERVVLKESQQEGFFADPANRKFDICQIQDVPEPKQRLKAEGIAFAIYRRGDTAASGALHPKVAVFVLSEPFSNLQEPYAEGDEPWWDYHHILIFGDDATIRGSASAIWDQYYSPARSRNVDKVLKEVEPLKPIRPEEFFRQICISDKRRDELLRHVQIRVTQPAKPTVIPLNKPTGTFTIPYESGETICGHYSGIDHEGKEPRQALVCVGGFTEYRHSKLLEIFEKELAKESIVQFFYEVSPEIEYATLTGYAEDMRAVLSYVNGQGHVVHSNRLVLVARSINGFLAALVGAEQEYEQMLAGLILVAPVFDVIEMMDNYRALHGDQNVRIERLWRREAGFNDAAEWEFRGRDPNNPGRDWLNFFNQHVSLAVMADIIRQDDPERFRLKSFIDSVGLFSQERPVYILSNPDDPVTGSKRALQALRNAASGSGKIRSDHFKHIDIQSSHDVQNMRDAYPWAYRQETQKTHEALKEMFQHVGIQTLV